MSVTIKKKEEVSTQLADGWKRTSGQVSGRTR